MRTRCGRCSGLPAAWYLRTACAVGLPVHSLPGLLAARQMQVFPGQQRAPRPPPHHTPTFSPCAPPSTPNLLRRSVIETIKIVTETLEALFDMKLAIPAGVVRCLTEGVDLGMQK